MKNEILKKIRNAESVKEVKEVVREAAEYNMKGMLSDEAYSKILDYATVVIKSLTAF